MFEPKVSKITNQDRIIRIANRMCEANMNCIIRTKREVSLGIRATFHIIKHSGQRTFLCFNEVSDKGLERLHEGDHVRVEVIGMPSQVTFTSDLLKKADGGVFVSLPKALTSIERRQNARYSTSAKNMAFLKLGDWSVNSDDIAAPPIIDPYINVSSWFPLADISIGGTCVMTHFPSVLSAIESGVIDVGAHLIFPMLNPLPVEIEFRWQKKTSTLVNVDGIERHKMQYRFGIEFKNPSAELTTKARQFMRQIAMADAI